MTEAFEFAVPATCANLGPGFGVLALALDLPMEVSVQPGAGHGHEIERRGTVQEMRMDARHDAILRGLHVGAERFSIKLPASMRIVAAGSIPPASGLGSQTASCAAGVGIALRFARRQPPTHDVLDLLVELGADPAHGAAALAGGFTAVCQTSSPNAPLHFRIVPQALHPAWRFVVVCPDVRITTADTQRILPPTLPHAVTPRTSSRLLGLLHALAHGDESLLAAYLFDEVHVPFRRRLVQGIETALAAGRDAGAAGVTISGHGPGLVALTLHEKRREQIGTAMAEAFAQAGHGATVLHLQASPRGALP